MHFSDDEIMLMCDILIKLVLEDNKKRKVKSDIDKYIDSLKPNDVNIKSTTHIEISETVNSGSDEEIPVSKRGRGRPRKNS